MLKAKIVYSSNPQEVLYYYYILNSDKLSILLKDKNIVSQVSTVTNDVIETFKTNYGAYHSSPLPTFADCAIDISNGSSFAMTAEYPVAEAIVNSNKKNELDALSYEKQNEINKLNRSIQDSIDKTDNVASQKELRKLQQELLAMQEDGVNVS